MSIFLWGIALTFIGFMVFGLNLENEKSDKTLSRGALVFYLSTRWLFWSLGLGYLIFACVNSRGGKLMCFY